MRVWTPPRLAKKPEPKTHYCTPGYDEPFCRFSVHAEARRRSKLTQLHPEVTCWDCLDRMYRLGIGETKH